MLDARTHVVLVFYPTGKVEIIGEAWFRVPANFDTLDKITNLFRLTKADAETFAATLANANRSARYCARALSDLDLPDLKRQNAKAEADAIQRLEDMPAPARRLPRHVTDYGRRLATRHAAEQVFEPQHQVIVEKVKSRRVGNGVRLTRRVQAGRVG